MTKGWQERKTLRLRSGRLVAKRHHLVALNRKKVNWEKVHKKRMQSSFQEARNLHIKQKTLDRVDFKNIIDDPYSYLAENYGMKEGDVSDYQIHWMKNAFGRMVYDKNELDSIGNHYMSVKSSIWARSGKLADTIAVGQPETAGLSPEQVDTVTRYQKAKEEYSDEFENKGKMAVHTFSPRKSSHSKVDYSDPDFYSKLYRNAKPKPKPKKRGKK